MSLYFDYLKERENKLVLENEHGFVLYQIYDDFIYIVDIYVKPEMRKMGVARALADKVCEIAMEKNLKSVIGSVDLGTLGATESVSVLLAYGMRIDSVNGKMLYFKKDIGG